MTLRAQLLGKLRAPTVSRAQLCALLRKNLDAAAHSAATSTLNLRPQPSEAQRSAGNYKKGHVRFAGLSVAIENPAGSYRRPEWPAMQAHYGYVKGTEGADGDCVDCFLRPSTPLDWDGDAYVINQVTAQGRFDEHKVMLGYDSQEQAVKVYQSHYPSGWAVGPVTTMSLERLREWLRTEDTTSPVAKAEWNEEDHPRDEEGKFTDGSGGTVVEGALSGREESVLARYKRTGYYTINDSLRRGDESNTHTMADVALLDGIIDRSMLQEDIKVFRVLDGKRVGDKYLNAKPGTVITDKGFMSTSTLEDRAYRAVQDAVGGRIKTDTVLEIEVGTGAHAYDMEASRGQASFAGVASHALRGESELLFPRGSSLEIISVDKEARRVRARLVPTVKKVQASRPLGRVKLKSMEKLA